MDYGVDILLLIGAVAILGGAAFLSGMVKWDLAPVAGLVGRQSWVLAGALGFGVIAFAIKLLAIALIALLSPHPGPVRYGRAVNTEIVSVARDETNVDPVRLWQSLPDKAPAPAFNPTTPEKVALGRRLFFDTRLSRDSTVACVSCHDLAAGGADARARSLGVGGAQGARNAPSVYNAAFQKRLFWDGRAHSLEEQALGPLLNPAEMAMIDVSAVEQAVRAAPEYPGLFAAAFDDPRIDISRITQALAAFERTLVTADAPYDRFVNGDNGALGVSALRGMALFQELGCLQCHAGPNFSSASQSPHSSALRIFPVIQSPLLARYPLQQDGGAGDAAHQRGIWRVPSLRNGALTAPYFHNGSVPSLAEAVRIMATTQCNAVLAEDRHIGRQIAWATDRTRLVITDRRVLTEGDVADIVSFLESLTGDRLAASARAATNIVSSRHALPLAD